MKTSHLSPTAVFGYQLRLALTACAACSACFQQAAADEWQLGLRVTRTTITSPAVKPSPVTDGSSAPVTNTSAPEAPLTETHITEEQVSFGGGHMVIADEEKTKIYDFTAKRYFVLPAAADDYEDISLYALCAFRVRELQNRLFLGEAMGSAGVQADNVSFDRLDMESLFGLELPNKPSRAAGITAKPGEAFARNALADGTVTFSREGRAVTSFTPGSIRLSGARRRHWERYIVHACHIHPRIRSQIIAGGHLPGRLEFSAKDMNRTEKIAIEFIGTASAPDRAPARRLAGRTPRPPGAAKELEAIVTRAASTAPPTKADAIAFARKAIAEDRPLDGLLALLEYGLQSGDQPTGEIRRHNDVFKEDSQCRRFFSGGPQSTKEERERTLAAYDSIEREGLEKACVLDILRANMLAPLGKPAEAKRLFLAALEANPFLSGVYNDLGNLYYHAYNMAAAWVCWDAGRRLHPDHPLLESATDLERRLERDFPALF
ncbi:MAG: hypothetical protein ACREIA_18240 [Opitutaceae bacterium]